MELPTLTGLPQPEGIHATDVAATDGRPLAAAPPRLRALHELAQEFIFFNHGPLLTHGHLTVDPVVDYCEQHNVPPAERPMLYQGRRPFFSGIDLYYDSSEGRPDWDRTLLMVPKPRWPGLCAHLAAVAAADTLRKNFFWALPAEFWLAEQPDTPAVPVVLFGLNANYGLYEFRRYSSDPADPITLCRLAAEPAARKFAADLFAGDPRPYRSLEQAVSA